MHKFRTGPPVLLLLLLLFTSAAQATHTVFIVNQTNAGECLGDGFAGEGHAYGGNFTNITHPFIPGFVTTEGFAANDVAAGAEIGSAGDRLMTALKSPMTSLWPCFRRSYSTSAFSMTDRWSPNSSMCFSSTRNTSSSMRV